MSEALPTPEARPPRAATPARDAVKPTRLTRRTVAIAVAYAPVSQLFPRAAAVVHQGGVGTTQQALRAGRPQLVVPFLGDQFDNAARVVRLGCGAPLGRTRYKADRVATVLDRLFSDPGVAETAARLGVVAGREDGAAVAAERIVQMLSLSRRERA